ncbi:MAG: metallophosphoesterase [Marinilabiliales bacterium]
MIKCYHVSDLHGKIDRYEKLFELIYNNPPDILFIGGDLLPNPRMILPDGINDFVFDYLVSKFEKIKTQLGNKYPKVLIILGNDDPKAREKDFIRIDNDSGLWNYIHNKKISLFDFDIYGYANIPPTPFLYKDWERYDVSRYADPGCIHPIDGIHNVINPKDIEYETIAKDLEILTNDDKLDRAVFLFHSPPYKTKLDRAALDGKTFDHVPLDVHVGSIAIQRFIETKQPYLTLHGHIHESSSITGYWKDKIQNTIMFNAAYNKEELAVIIFDLLEPDNAKRILIK